MNKQSMMQMFGQSAGCVENDMDRIVGRVGPALSEQELQTMNQLAILWARGDGNGSGMTADQKNLLELLVRRHVANGGKDPRTPVNPEDPSSPGPGPGDGSFNTIAKSVFLLFLTPMFSGTVATCVAVCCSAAIIYSFIKPSNR